MDANELFRRTMDDLDARTTATDEYEALMAAGLLRKLLMDQKPLMDQVNRTIRMKVRFPINGVSPYEAQVFSLGPVYWSLEDGIDTQTNQPPGLQAPMEATRDQLLARRVLFIQGHDVTVRDLIDWLAHIEGAVHPENPKERQE